MSDDYMSLIFEACTTVFDPLLQHPHGMNGLFGYGKFTRQHIVDAMIAYKKHIVHWNVSEYYSRLCFRSTTPLGEFGIIYLSYDFHLCHRKDHVLSERVSHEVVRIKPLE